MMRLRVPAFVALALLAGTAYPVAAADRPEFTIEIRDHRFEPAELHVPAGTRIKLIVVNLDPTPEEFESYDLNREKIVAGNSRITVFIGPLEPGTYEYFGEFNMDTALGTIVAE
jgi:plastocyanin